MVYNHRLGETMSPRTLPNASGVRADSVAHDTLLACERRAELSVDTSTWWWTTLINFVDLRTDPALKIFVYMLQYKQRSPILFPEKRSIGLL